MPVQKVKGGYRWGKTGKIYKTKEEAEKQMQEVEMKKKWQKSLGEYLQKRNSLKGIVVLMDIRHPFKDLDQELIQWAVASNLPVLALLTKADKLKSGKRKAQVLMAREAALAFCGDVTVHSFSSLKKTGLPELQSVLNQWFELES